MFFEKLDLGGEVGLWKGATNVGQGCPYSSAGSTIFTSFWRLSTVVGLLVEYDIEAEVDRYCCMGKLGVVGK